MFKVGDLVTFKDAPGRTLVKVYRVEDGHTKCPRYYLENTDGMRGRLAWFDDELVLHAAALTPRSRGPKVKSGRLMV